MNGNNESPSEGDKTGEEHEKYMTATAFDEEEREVVAWRLRTLASHVQSDLRQLAADVEAGDEIPEERIRDARQNLHSADATVRRSLGAPDFLNLSTVERDPRELDHASFAEVDGDIDYLRNDAPREEVARRLAAAVLEARMAADDVDSALYSGDLTDAHIEELWDAAGTVQAWARDVLQPDRRLRLTREEAEARDEENGEDTEENHA